MQHEVREGEDLTRNAHKNHDRAMAKRFFPLFFCTDLNNTFLITTKTNTLFLII